MNSILLAAQRAYAETDFYQLLYKNSPVDLNDIPFINHAHYHQAQGVLDCITDRSEVSGAFAAYHRNVRKFPFTVVESDTEQKHRHRRFIYSLEQIGVRLDSPKKFLLLADDSRGPFAGELATCLAWEHHQASITYIHGSKEQLSEDIRSYDPDYILNVSGLPSDLDRFKANYEIITIHHVDYLIPEVDQLLLACDEIGVFAFRKKTSDSFSYDRENLSIEINPASQLPAITTINFGISPFIRYCPAQDIINFDV